MVKSVIEVLEALESVSGRLAKEAILKEHESNELLESAFVAALDPYRVYYVNKFKMPKPAGADRDDAVVASFLGDVLPHLAMRSVTGNKAKLWVEKAFATMDELQQKWCKRILLKNLRCGVQASTVNKIWPGLINPFECALCESLKTQPVKKGGFKIVETIRYPVFVDPKLDGLRLITVKKNGKATMYTRNGSEIDTLPGIVKDIENAEFDNVVFDGEALGKNWNESNSVLMSSKRRKDESKIFYNVFDAMVLNEWIEQGITPIYSQRVKFVEQLLELMPDGTNVRAIEHDLILDESGLRECYERHVAAGYEGIVIKDPYAPYVFKRSKALLKLKPITTYEGAIVGWYKGRDNTKNESGFGGFDVVLPNGVVTKCGGGFSDDQRAEIMATGPLTYRGKIIEMEGQPPLTADGKIRFPVFVRYREAADVDRTVTYAYEEYVAAERVVNV